jgi:biopolymer transport protein ExbB/TolQ
MTEGVFGDSTRELLNTVAQSLLIPVILVLILSLVAILLLVGSVIVEIIVERRHFRVVMPVFLNDLTNATAQQVPEVIAGSGLLRRQRDALTTLFDNRGLPVEARTALARRLIADDEMRFQRIVGFTDLLSRIAPMLGLMATLIPLGPGIIALGQGQVDILSESLLTAFDATVAGLAAAVVSLAVSKLRKHWYENYMISLEAGANTILEKIAILDENNALELGTPPRSGIVDTGAAAAIHGTPSQRSRNSAVGTPPIAAPGFDTGEAHAHG